MYYSNSAATIQGDRFLLDFGNSFLMIRIQTWSEPKKKKNEKKNEKAY
jgi:hypothetical protein